MRDIGYKIYLIYIVSWFLHLGSRFPGLGKIRIDFLLFGILFILAIPYLKEQTLSMNDREDQTGKYLSILILYIIISIPLVKWPGSVIKQNLVVFLKAIVFYYFTVIFITNKKQLQTLVFIFIACQLIRVLEPLYLHITVGYWGGTTYMAGENLNRLAGGPHDFVNANGLAYIIVSVIPFLYSCALNGKSLILKLLGLSVLLPLFYALVLTSSRSGMLAFIIIIFSYFYKSKKRMLLGVFIVISACIAILSMGDDSIDRYRSIFDKTSKNASTAQGRIRGAVDSFAVALNRPVFGHGLGTSFEATFGAGIGELVKSHILYAQIIQELGIIGLGIFLLFMKAIFENYRKINNIVKIKKDEISKDLINLSDALQVFFIMNLAFSLFSYGLSGYAWYLMAGFSVVLIRLFFSNYTNNAVLQNIGK